MAQNVQEPKFYFGSKAAYEYATHEVESLYFIVDTQDGSTYGKIFKGDICYATTDPTDLGLSEALTKALAKIDASTNAALAEIKIKKDTALEAIANKLNDAINAINTVTISGQEAIVSDVSTGLLEINEVIDEAKDYFGTLVDRIEEVINREDFEALLAAIESVGDVPRLHVFNTAEEFPVIPDTSIYGIYVDTNEHTLYQWDSSLLTYVQVGGSGIVYTFDTSVDFPDVGDVSTLYIADDENKMYRWCYDPEKIGSDREYVEIAGSGGGGGGTGVTTETVVKFKDSKTTGSVAKGASFNLVFAFSSAHVYTKYDESKGEFVKVQQQTGTTGTAKYYIDGVQFDSGTVQQANYYEDPAEASKNVYNTYTVPAAMFTGSEHTIKVEVSDVSGNKASETITVTVASISISCAYTPTPTPLTSNINIPTTVASQESVTVYYKVDDGSPVTAGVVSTGSGTITVSIPPTGMTHNVHTIQVWATTYVSESASELSTEIKEFNVIWYDVNNTQPIAAMSIDAAHDELMRYTSTQYDFVTASYQVYTGSSKSEVRLMVEENGTKKLVNTVSVDSTIHTWVYTFENYGTYRMYLGVVKDSLVYENTGYTITVAESSYKLEPEAGSVVFFTAKNRSNDEPASTRSVWKSEVGDYTATFTNFAWNDNSGWYNDGTKTALRVSGDARCTLPYQPFKSDKRSTGQVIEFDFSTTNLSNSTATVIKCYTKDTEGGIVINANNAYFISQDFSKSSSADSRISVPFKENERLRITFVITPNNADDAGNATHNVEVWDSIQGKYVTKESVSLGWWRFVKIYINGKCVAINKYVNSFTQATPVNIEIGSNDATVDLYSFRAYEKVLYDRGIVNNYVADTQDPTERLQLFTRNNILSTDGTNIDYSKLLKQMPCFFITCESDVTDPEDPCNNNDHILPKNKSDKRGFTVIYNCDMMDDTAKAKFPFTHSFIAYNAQMTVQGTSSQYYPRKNYKFTLRTQKKWLDGASEGTLAAYNAILSDDTNHDTKPTMVFLDHIGTTKSCSGTGGTDEGKTNRLEDFIAYKNAYKNKLTLKDYSLTEGLEYSDLLHITTIPAKKFCLKADFAESSSVHNTGFAKFADYMLKSLGSTYLTPPQLAQYQANSNNMNKVSTRTTVDGYPSAIFWRKRYTDTYQFLGKYNFNLDKGAEDTFGFVGDIVESETILNPRTGYPFLIFDEEYYEAANDTDRLAYESPIECWEFLNNSEDISKFRNVTDETFLIPSEEYGMAWLGSFEARHPDNNKLVKDYESQTLHKDPKHWRTFLKWVSSTDRLGYHGDSSTLRIPYAWNGTYAELISGTGETYTTYDGTLDPYPSITEIKYNYLNGDASADPTKTYILEPQKIIDPGTGEKGPDTDYTLFGHISRYDSSTELWYDDGPYVKPTGADTDLWYYINSDTDTQHYKKVYAYNKVSLAWELKGTLDNDYLLSSPVTYETKVYKYDTADYRLKKFEIELPNHMNINMTTAYYAMTEFFACVDQRAKNMMFASWGYEETTDKPFKPASTYASEEIANAAGYKGVYTYKVSVPNLSSSNILSSSILGASSADVCINEVDPDVKKMEFYNPTDASISLNGYILKGTDEEGAARDDWAFPSTAVIGSKGFYVITFKSKDTTQGPSYGLSGSKAWSFNLVNPDESIADTFAFSGTPEIEAGKSYGRETDGSNTIVYFDTPTIGSTNAPVEPEIPEVTLSSHTSKTTTIQEFSGICFNADKTSLYAVGDGGIVYTLTFDGVATELTVPTAALTGKDLEGITIANDNKLYTIVENTGEVYKIDPDNNYATTLAFTVTSVSTDPENNGFEGIAAYGDNFIVANQKNPIALYLVTRTGTSTLMKNLTCVTEIADVCYDGTNIWVLDSNTSNLVKLDTDCEPVTRYLMPFIATSANAEALTISDTIAYIGCDNTENRELYKVSLTNEPLTKSVVFNEFDPDFKLIELYNVTSSAIDLTGYSMTKEDDETTKFTFGSKTIPANGYLVLPLKSDGVAGPTFGMSGDKGFEYKLFNTDGNVVDRVDNTGDTKVVIADGETYGRTIDGADTFTLFRMHGTIGSSNANGIISAGLYINEVDTTGTSIGKRFELYNSSTTNAYDLTGHTFIKDGSEWSVVDTAVGEDLGLPTITVPPTGYLVVQCNNTKSSKATEESPAKDPTKWPDFGLSGDKGFILEIKNANGQYIDRVNNLIEGVVNPNAVVIPDGSTWGRASDGIEHNFALFSTPTMGAANANPILYTAERSETSDIYINEIDCNSDKIELYNDSETSIDIKDYIISKNGDTLTMWKVPTSTILPRKGFLVINCKQWDYAQGPSFGLGASSGFYLSIADSSGNILDVVDNRPTSEGYLVPSDTQTMGREEDGADDWVIYSTGSMGETNANGTIYNPPHVDPGTPITDRVVINEIAYRQIELYNTTSSSVNLGGKYLVKTPQADDYNSGLLPGGDGRSDAFRIPDNTTIGAHEFLTFVCQGESAVLSPQFGLSFKDSSKKFDLYLMHDIGSMATATGPQTIDSALVIDHIDNYTNPVVDANNAISIGRVKDGYSTICKFATPTIGATNNNSTPIPIDEQEEYVTIKTIKYWVPIDAEYIYYPIFYDNDTIMSLNNTGYIKFDPNVESTDTIGTGYAYNGTESALWLNFKDAYATQIANVYTSLRNTALTYANCLKFFNETQSDIWPEVLYNLDAKFKYVDPATIGYTDFSINDTEGNPGVNVQDDTYLYECQGSREEHRKWWLTNRFTYTDSRYNTSEYHDNYMTMRLYTPKVYEKVTPDPTFKLIPYTDMYMRVRFGSIDSYIRATKNTEYEIKCEGFSPNDTETIIYGADNIISMGSIANKYAGSLSIAKGSRLTKLDAGEDSPYYNTNLTEVSIAETNKSLKYVDVRGCTKLTSFTGLNKINAIETFKAVRTGLTDIQFATTGINLKYIEYPESIATVKVVSAPYLTTANMIFASHKNITTLWIEDCPQVSAFSILTTTLNTTGNALRFLHITDVDWTFNTESDFNNIWKKILTLKGVTATTETDLPYLTGVVKFGTGITVSDGYKETLEAQFKAQGCDLTITPSKTTTMTGITISGPSTVESGSPATYTVSYLPDDYVKNKGVTWSVAGSAYSKVTIDSSTTSQATVTYHGSAAEGTTFNMVAHSISYPGIQGQSNPILVEASLKNIKIIYNDTEINDGDTVSLTEENSYQFKLNFVPENTTDKNITCTVTGNGAAYISSSYDQESCILTLTLSTIPANTTAAVKIQSTTILSVYKTFNIRLKNIVSRIVYIKDQSNKLINGNLRVKNLTTGVETYLDSSSAVGVIPMPANDSRFGYDKLEVTNIQPTTYDSSYYDKKRSYTFDSISEETVSDITYDAKFYEPIELKLTLQNNGYTITSERFKVYSTENTTRSMTVPPYNNVYSDNGIATIKVLANTKHHITITPEFPSTSQYGSYEGTINITTLTPVTKKINIARNYLNGVEEYDNTKLHMTVVTGSGEFKTLRLYYASTDAVVIDWGDNALQVLPSTSGVETEVLHTYANTEHEYDIWIDSEDHIIEGTKYSSNLSALTWLHGSKSSETSLSPCIGDGNTTSATYNYSGGIVAYQSIGSANITSMIRFNTGSQSASQLISVGNIYKKCTEATSAKELFKDTTLEQIYYNNTNNISLFTNCTNITTFNSTFKNCNITAIPGYMFYTCKKAIDFESTFENCKMLTTVNASEDEEFIIQNSDVEVTSLLNMFKNCTSFNGILPAFWKSFYGCSFVESTSQLSFTGCTNAENYAASELYHGVPISWGGAAPEYYDSQIHQLRYVAVLPTEGNPEIGMYGYFEAGGDNAIYLKNTYSYIFKYKMCWHANPRFRYPLFGSAHTTTGLESGIDGIVDFTRFGNAGGNNGDIDCSEYLTYRNNMLSSTGDPFNVALNESTQHKFIRRDKQTNWPDPGENYPNDTFHSTKEYTEMGDVVLDIGHSEPGQATLTCTNWAAEGGKEISDPEPVSFNVPETEDIFECNLPLRVLFTYGMGNIDYTGEGSTEDPGFSVFNDPTTQNYGVGISSSHKRYAMNECYFKSLEIYDGTTLIHKLVPAYAIVEDNRGIALYDTETQKSWAGIGKALIPYGVTGHCNDQLKYYKL